MTAAEVMAELEAKGTAQTKKTFLRHGAVEPFFGVKVADLKVIQKRVKTNHKLALELYATGNGDAMYLAGLIADPHAFTRAELDRWAKAATWHMISDYAVAWNAAESPHAVAAASKWIDAKPELVRSAGWATLSGHVAVTDDDELDLDLFKGLLDRVVKDLPAAPDRVKLGMNGFVIAVGGYVAPLTAAAKAAAKRLGAVTADMGDTDCKVPDAAGYIDKMVARGVKKRKTAKC